jgi:predicted amidohydrolase
VRRCRVAATQVDVRHGDVEHNLETHVRLIAEAATAGCELVVFPELSVTGHNGSPEVTRGAERADGRIAQVIEEAARASGIVASYGFCELHRGTHLPHANRTLEAPDGSHAFDGREREAGTDELLRAQETLLADSPVPPRLHDVMARDNGVFAVFSDQVGFDGHSTHVGGAYVLAPDGAMIARTESGLETTWIAAELDPDVLARVRASPSFPLRKRRPEAYEELTLRS